MRIGIYSGSFNPVHVGHISLVDFIIEQDTVDEIWLIRSPQNPLKASNSLLSDEHRARMLELAIQGHRGLKISTIEDNLPKPNYTINTLNELHRQFPEEEFYLIIGADNWEIFNKWKDWDKIIRDYHLIVYPRPGYEMPMVDNNQYPNVMVVNAPLFDVSSTEIRDRRSRRKTIRDLVPSEVEKYIKSNKLYL